MPIQVVHVQPNARLPFGNATFDLATCCSVIEFVSREEDRVFLASELERVVAPNGIICLTTPNAYQIRELHSGRFLGNLFKKDGFPWATKRRTLMSYFPRSSFLSAGGYYVQKLRDRLHVPVPPRLGRLLEVLAPWQTLIFQKRE